MSAGPHNSAGPTSADSTSSAAPKRCRRPPEAQRGDRRHGRHEAERRKQKEQDHFHQAHPPRPITDLATSSAQCWRRGRLLRQYLHSVDTALTGVLISANKNVTTVAVGR